MIICYIYIFLPLPIIQNNNQLLYIFLPLPIIQNNDQLLYIFLPPPIIQNNDQLLYIYIYIYSYLYLLYKTIISCYIPTSLELERCRTCLAILPHSSISSFNIKVILSFVSLVGSFLSDPSRTPGLVVIYDHAHNIIFN